ncbi:hypothetical protein C8R42DRAFT_690337 [Lentinula raphanica]|nr:hypothetical protein C8R42DRAFT_690337 [Lentinula raphanica]
MNFRDCLALFSRFTKVLVIDCFSRSGTGDRILSQTLPQLEHLFFVELRNGATSPDLLRTILAHPTVTSVLVNNLPHESMRNDDLSKVIFDYQTARHAFTPHFQMYLNQGMRLACLELPILTPFGVVQSDFKILNGLEKIQVHTSMVTDLELISSSWLSALSSMHPTLNEFWFLHYTHDRSARQTTPFLSSFLEESRKQDLEKFITIRRFGLCRALAHASQEWHVMGLVLKPKLLCTSLLEILMLTASSFPKLKTLTLDLILLDTMHSINDFASVLARFPSLRVLCLKNVFRQINLESDMPLAQIDSSTNGLDVPKDHAEHQLLLLTSCLAKQVRTLDSIHIDEQSYEQDNPWSLRGWLHVLNGNREVGGTLRLPWDSP